MEVLSSVPCKSAFDACHALGEDGVWLPGKEGVVLFVDGHDKDVQPNVKRVVTLGGRYHVQVEDRQTVGFVGRGNPFQLAGCRVLAGRVTEQCMSVLFLDGTGRGYGAVWEFDVPWSQVDKFLLPGKKLLGYSTFAEGELVAHVGDTIYRLDRKDGWVDEFTGALAMSVQHGTVLDREGGLRRRQGGYWKKGPGMVDRMERVQKTSRMVVDLDTDGRGVAVVTSFGIWTSTNGWICDQEVARVHLVAGTVWWTAVDGALYSWRAGDAKPKAHATKVQRMSHDVRDVFHAETAQGKVVSIDHVSGKVLPRALVVRGKTQAHAYCTAKLRDGKWAWVRCPSNYRGV